MNAVNKARIVRDIRDSLIRKYPSINMARNCVFAALHTIQILRAEGIAAIPQAGDMSWLFTDPQYDDGVSPTHFSFQWSPHELKSIIAVSQGNLPEIHVWAAIVETQEIVDINTCYIPQLLKEDLPQCQWTAKQPPDFLWGDTHVVAKYKAIYTPHHDATIYAMQVMQAILRRH